MKRTRLKSVSNKRQKQYEKYSKIRLNFLAEHQICEICNSACSQDIHHKRGRNNERLLDANFFMAICRRCHIKIHLNPKWAYDNQYMLTR